MTVLRESYRWKNSWRGKSARVVGLRDDKVIDMDIHEALAMKKDFDKYTYKMTQILSI